MVDRFPSEARDTPVSIRVNGACIEGNLNVPEGAHGLVIFSHGSGSGRYSPRNRYVASTLRDARLATLLSIS